MNRKILRWSNVRKTVNYLKKNGVRHAWYAAKERMEEERKDHYTYIAPARERLEQQRKESTDGALTFSIVVPAYETDERFLREMVDSVLMQSYAGWELIIADAGKSAGVQQTIEEILQKTGETRVRYRKLPENRGISENTNAGIEMATGEYIALLDHDDMLTPDALYEMATAVERNKQCGILPELLYSDEDKYDDNTCSYINNHCKMDFNLDLILSNNYICHFMAVKSETMKELMLRDRYDGAQDYDLVLRVVGKLMDSMPPQKLAEHIVHVPKVLYHWRCHADSTAENTASKSYAYEAGKRALEDFCTRRGWKASVEHSLHLGFYDLQYEPDILTVRQDVGIVGGRLLDGRRRIRGGIYDAKGDSLYLGLHCEYSGGSTHRAVLKQDCAAVDIRCMRVRKELWETYREVTGIRYSEREVKLRAGKRRKKVSMYFADVSALQCDEAGYRKLGRELCHAAARRGYLIVWDPEMTVTIHP